MKNEKLEKNTEKTEGNPSLRSAIAAGVTVTCVGVENGHSARQRGVNTQKNVSKIGHRMSKSWTWFPLHSGKASQQG